MEEAEDTETLDINEETVVRDVYLWIELISSY
jgi:hypothetical protein